MRLLVGELRQGALEGVMIEAVAAAAGAAGGRRAARGDASPAASRRVARAALSGGRQALRQLRDPADAAGAADARAAGRGHGGGARRSSARRSLEWKLDGARVQVHKAGDEVRVYTRNLNDVTAAVPEIVAALQGRACAGADPRRRGDRAAPRRRAASVPGHDAPLRPQARRRRACARELPLSVFFFDCLLRDGTPLVDRPARERRERSATSLPAALRDAARSITADVAAGRRAFYARRARARPRRRDGQGAGRAVRSRAARRGLAQGQARAHARPRGARGRVGPRPAPAAGCRTCTSARATRRAASFVMLGKTFKGMTDEMLAWQTQRAARARDAARRLDACTCARSWWSRSRSTTCRKARSIPAGWRCASRASRAIAPTSAPEEADTIDTVRRIYEGAGVKTLAEWLAFIERQHPKTIALGLERVAEVLARMQVTPRCPVITVGGHQRQGLDLRDARVDPALRRLPHRALHLAASRALQRARAHRRRRSER